MPLVMLPDDSNLPILRAIMLALSFAMSFSKYQAKLDDRAVPWVTYCDPELAHVGLGLDDAKARFGSDQGDLS
jgi:pyruvate/2-oxoglutarate dehydrogenase complex dihydrolipoamide dehydrogenase (E3) component